MKNLDLLAAQTAQKIIADTRGGHKATEVDNLITKALGVLQENGVYAGLLYLYSRSDKERLIAKQIHKQLLRLTPLLLPSLKKEIADEIVAEDVMAETALNFLTQHICKDLDILLLVKQLWEQTLIYARYGAKAREAEDKAREDAAKARLAEEAKSKS